MARRSFDVFDLIELFTHWHAGLGWPQSKRCAAPVTDCSPISDSRPESC
jgi:hypothetical protein